MKPSPSLLIPLIGLFGCAGTGVANTGAADDAGVVGCGADQRVEIYSPGLTRLSDAGGFHAELLTATPAPPAAGSNSWLVHMSLADGGPLSGAPFAVVPVMPDHGHGASATPVVSPNGDGLYTVSNLDLFMPGVWQITFNLEGADGGLVDSAAYLFCVP